MADFFAHSFNMFTIHLICSPGASRGLEIWKKIKKNLSQGCSVVFGPKVDPYTPLGRPRVVWMGQGCPSPSQVEFRNFTECLLNT